MPQWAYYQNTGLLKVFGDEVSNPMGNPEALKGERGTHLSASSRRRLFVRMMKLEWGALPPHMVTLTYRNEQEIATAKKHCKEFCRRVTAYALEPIIVWRVEFQRRGAVHFHLAVENNGSDWLERRGRDNWCDITGDVSRSHLKYGFNIVNPTKGDTRHVVALYVAGHTAKANYQSHAPDGVSVGRWWGILNARWHIPKTGWMSQREGRAGAHAAGGAVMREFAMFGWTVFGESGDAARAAIFSQYGYSIGI